MKQPLEIHRPNLFMLGIIASLCSLLVAFEWKILVDKPMNEFVDLEEFEIIEADVIPPKMAEHPPTYEKLKPSKKRSNRAPSVSRRPAMAGLSPILRTNSSRTNRISTAALTPKTAHDVLNISVLSPAEMPYFLDCAELEAPDERFACTQRYLKASLVSNLRLPGESVVRELPGKVRVFFIVDEFGQVVDVSIDRSVHPAIEEAIGNAFKELPVMMPGGQGNRKVKVRFVQPLDLVRIQ